MKTYTVETRHLEVTFSRRPEVEPRAIILDHDSTGINVKHRTRLDAIEKQILRDLIQDGILSLGTWHFLIFFEVTLFDYTDKIDLYGNSNNQFSITRCFDDEIAWAKVKKIDQTYYSRYELSNGIANKTRPYYLVRNKPL